MPQCPQKVNQQAKSPPVRDRLDMLLIVRHWTEKHMISLVLEIGSVKNYGIEPVFQPERPCPTDRRTRHTAEACYFARRVSIQGIKKQPRITPGLYED